MRASLAHLIFYRENNVYADGPPFPHCLVGMGFLLVRGWITLTVTTGLLLVIDAFFAPSSRSIYGIQHSLNPPISFHCSQGSRIKRRLTEEDISVNRGQDEADIVVIGSGIAG